MEGSPIKSMKQIGSYILINEIGKGTYGVVFKGDPPSAIKMIDRVQFDDAAAKNISQEINASRVADHPNLVKLITLLVTKNHYYFVFEYCDQGDLNNYISKNANKISLSVKIQFIRDIIHGYLYLYDHKIMHRDIKPENVLLKSVGSKIVAKIGDFGFAKQYTEQKLNEVYFQSIVGTPLTMSPEIYFEKDYNVESDIWSLGILFYYIIFEKFPFPAKSRIELKHMLENKEYEMDLIKYPITYETMLLISDCLQANIKDRLTPNSLKKHVILNGSIDDLKLSVRTGFKMLMYTNKSNVITKDEWMKF